MVFQSNVRDRSVKIARWWCSHPCTPEAWERIDRIALKRYGIPKYHYKIDQIFRNVSILYLV